MPEDKPTPPPHPVQVPRPPGPAATDKLSEQQGMVTDEWTGEPAASDDGQG